MSNQESDSPLVQLRDSDMSQISKNFLFDGMILPIPIYVRLKEDTYILVSKKGEKAQISTMKSYKHENFKIYVRSIEKSTLTSYIENLTARTIENPQIPLQQKKNFVMGLLDSSVEEFEKSQFSNMVRLRSVGSMIGKLAKQTPGVNKALELLESSGAAENRHAMMTAMISLIIAQEAGMVNAFVEEKLVIGALLHDVGMRALPPELMKKSRPLWSPEEIVLYEQHPIKGAEMLRHVEGMSVEVLLIVAEHHETSQGSGFPKKIRDVKINPLAKIVGLAEVVSELIDGSCGVAYTTDEAVQYIENVLGQPYNKQIFQALKNMVNVQYLQEKIRRAS